MPQLFLFSAVVVHCASIMCQVGSGGRKHKGERIDPALAHDGLIPQVRCTLRAEKRGVLGHRGGKVLGKKIRRE